MNIYIWTKYENAERKCIGILNELPYIPRKEDSISVDNGCLHKVTSVNYSIEGKTLKVIEIHTDASPREYKCILTKEYLKE